MLVLYLNILPQNWVEKYFQTTNLSSVWNQLEAKLIIFENIRNQNVKVGWKIYILKMKNQMY
jgi:Gpi18-like mannosyltransferase